MRKPKLCPKCKTNPPSKIDKTCPYDSDINNTETICYCCDECRHECLMNI